ncbi:methyl-accepting chemotaxis protein [Leeia sp. TBRC 13508]|uniref:Methyl-accepting chemotaxis protein n=1 Tax=Leeia speluncae TaxID=2884804 RepID=A0ABS8DAS7_9NEIS|nr:methyl-accepting chemotaxis protein [Leeia speluncae]MCB6185021.1 methyl-accepting chemotaxis protein [Leeia speluncae]
MQNSQSSLKLRSVLIGATVVSSLLLIILLVVSMASLRKMQVADAEEHRLTQGLSVNIADARFHIVQVQQFLTDASATGDKDGMTDAKEHYDALQVNLNNIASLDSSMSADAGRVTELSKVFFDVGNQMANAYIASGRDAGNAVMKKPQTGFDDRAAALTDEMDKLAKRVKDANLLMVTSNQQNIEQFSMLIIGLTVLTTLIVVVSGIFTYKKVFHTLGGEPADALAVAERIANGDLTHRITGEKGSLFEAFGKMQDQLKAMTGRIRDLSMELRANATNLSTASKSIQQSSHQQSDATATMSDSMQRIAENVEVLGTRTSDIGVEAINTQKSITNCEEMIHSTADTIRKIATEIGQASDAVHDLNKQTDQIASITHTIREISDQTNLLALNAAIESARAGEVGRGFAVVADEVRKLAERAGNATVEISAQIQAIRGSVDHAVSMMQSSVSASATSVQATIDASESISGIRENTHQITEHIQEIVSSLSDQQHAIKSMSSEIQTVAHLTLSNQASVDNSASAALQMQSHAEELAEAASAFRS